MVADMCQFMDVELPSDIDKMYSARINPTTKSQVGQSVSRGFFHLSRLAKKAPFIDHRMIRHYGSVLGVHCDKFFESRQEIRFDRGTGRMLAEDWRHTIDKAEELRGRELLSDPT
jgi:hypothetical protein